MMSVMKSDSSLKPSRTSTWIFVVGPPKEALRSQLAEAVERDFLDWFCFVTPSLNGVLDAHAAPCYHD